MKSIRCMAVDAAAILALLTAGSHVASAQEFDLENYHPVSPGDGELMSVSSTRQLHDKQLAMSLTFGVVDDPLVVVDENDDRVAEVIDRRAAAEIMAAYGLGRFELFAALPFILFQQADPNMDAGLAGVDDGGLGDIRLGGRTYLLDNRDGGLGLGAGMQVSLPTSVNAEFGGNDGPTAMPYITGDMRTGPVLVAANLGARIRGEEALGNLTVGTALTYGIGAGLRIGQTPVSVMSELAGEVNGSDTAESPMEVRGGARADLGGGFAATAGYGRGLIHGYGAPDHRFLAGVSYRPSPPKVAQRIIVQGDPIPVVVPPPNPDPDGDGILSEADSCPDDAEDYDGFEDSDGCPELDNDKDTLADADDACPNHAEDKDGFEDEDGCPDPDNDRDGLADTVDQCPDEAEVINGTEDDDGCPDEGKPLVLIGKNKLVIQDKVYFAHNKDVILERSATLLDQVAKTLERHPWIKKVRVEGHTDDRGNDEYNLELSNRRANAVMKALLDRGIDAGRLEAAGYGEQNPIDTNKSATGRANNRRVEFTILEQDESLAPARTGDDAKAIDDGVPAGDKGGDQ